MKTLLYFLGLRPRNRRKNSRLPYLGSSMHFFNSPARYHANR